MYHISFTVKEYSCSRMGDIALRKFAPIVSAHPYCARLRAQIHMPRHASSACAKPKMNNDRADGHCNSFASVDLTILDVWWPPLFFSETDVIYNYLHIVQKWTKNQCGKLKKIQDFCPRDMESCHLAAARRVKLWSLNANLFFEEPHQLTKFA